MPLQMDAAAELEEICKRFTYAVEGMAQMRAPDGDRAYTPAGTLFVTFVNGTRKPEGHATPDPAGYVPAVLADKTLDAVREYRAAVGGQARLVWRMRPGFEPREDGGLDFRCRLAFEDHALKPVPVVVDDGTNAKTLRERGGAASSMVDGIAAHRPPRRAWVLYQPYVEAPLRVYFDSKRATDDLVLVKEASRGSDTTWALAEAEIYG